MVAESHVAGSDPPAMVVTHEFAAPRELVWRVWTEPEHLRRWWGPKGFTVTHCAVDCRPGGVFHYCLASGGGQEMWGLFKYLEVIPPERLVYTNSFSDAEGNITRNPMTEGWPLELHNTLTFTEREGGTTLTLRAVPHNATDDEARMFGDSLRMVEGGFAAMLEVLAGYLAEVAEGAES